MQTGRCLLRTPNGIRTRAFTLKGWCPRPLDDGGLTDDFGVEEGAGFEPANLSVIRCDPPRLYGRGF